MFKRTKVNIYIYVICINIYIYFTIIAVTYVDCYKPFTHEYEEKHCEFFHKFILSFHTSCN
jgi:hypothetical protein